MGVVGHAVAAHLGVDLCAARLGVLERFEHQHGRAFAHDEPVARGVERSASAGTDRRRPWTWP